MVQPMITSLRIQEIKTLIFHKFETADEISTLVQ